MTYFSTITYCVSSGILSTSSNSGFASNFLINALKSAVTFFSGTFLGYFKTSKKTSVKNFFNKYIFKAKKGAGKPA